VLHAKRVEDSCCTRPTPCPAPVRLYFFDLSRVRVQQSGSVFFVSGPAPVPSFRALVFSASISYCRRLGFSLSRVKVFSPCPGCFPLRVQGLGFGRGCFTHESAPRQMRPSRSSSCVRFGAMFDVIFELPDQRARGFLILFTLKQLFPEHVYKMFGEITVRT
jgi:hypothetical protein